MILVDDDVVDEFLRQRKSFGRAGLSTLSRHPAEGLIEAHEQVLDLQEKLIALAGQRKHIKTEFANISDQNAALADRVVFAEDRCRNLDKFSNTVLERMRKLVKVTESLEAEKKKSDDLAEGTLNRLEETEELLQKVWREVKEVEGERERERAGGQEARAQVEWAERRITILEEAERKDHLAHATALQELEQRLSSSVAEREGLERTLRELRSKAEEEMVMRGRLEGRCVSLDGEVKEAEAKLALAEDRHRKDAEELKGAKAEILSVIAESNLAAERAKRAEERCGRVEERLAGVEERAVRAEERAGSAEGEGSALEVRLRSALLHTQAVQAELDKLKQHCIQLESDRSALRRQVEEKDLEAAQLQASHLHVTLQMGELEPRVAELKDAVAEASRLREEAEAARRESEDRVARMHRDNTSLAQDLDKEADHREKAEARLLECEQELGRLRSAAQGATLCEEKEAQRAFELERKHIELVQKNTELESMVKGLQVDCKTLESQNRQVWERVESGEMRLEEEKKRAADREVALLDELERTKTLLAETRVQMKVWERVESRVEGGEARLEEERQGAARRELNLQEELQHTKTLLAETRLQLKNQLCERSCGEEQRADEERRRAAEREAALQVQLVGDRDKAQAELRDLRDQLSQSQQQLSETRDQLSLEREQLKDCQAACESRLSEGVEGERTTWEARLRRSQGLCKEHQEQRTALEAQLHKVWERVESGEVRLEEEKKKAGEREAALKEELQRNQALLVQAQDQIQEVRASGQRELESQRESADLKLKRCQMLSEDRHKKCIEMEEQMNKLWQRVEGGDHQHETEARRAAANEMSLLAELEHTRHLMEGAEIRLKDLQDRSTRELENERAMWDGRLKRSQLLSEERASKCTELEANLRQFRERVESAESRMEACESRLEEERMQAGAREADLVRDLEDNMALLTEAKEQLKASRAAENAEALLVESEAGRRQAEASLRRTQALSQEHQTQREELEAKLIKLQGQSESKLDVYICEVEELKAANTRLAANKKIFDQEKVQLEEEIFQLKRSNETLMSESKSLKSEVSQSTKRWDESKSDLTKRLDTLQSEITAKQKTINSLQTRKESVELQNEQLQARVEEMRQRMEKVSHTSSSQLEEIHRVNDQIRSQLEGKVAERDKQLTFLKQERDRLQEGLSEAQRRVSEVQDRHRANQDQVVEKLRSEIDHLEKDLKLKTAEVDKLQARLDSQTLNDNLRESATIQELKMASTAALKEAERYRSKFLSSEEELQSSKIRSAALESGLADCRINVRNN